MFPKVNAIETLISQQVPFLFVTLFAGEITPCKPTLVFLCQEPGGLLKVPIVCCLPHARQQFSQFKPGAQLADGRIWFEAFCGTAVEYTTLSSPIPTKKKKIDL